MIRDHLDGLKSGFPDCYIVMLADISSDTVLCVSEAEQSLQETLDAYCCLAVEMLNGKTGGVIAPPGPEKSATDLAVVLASPGTMIFVRSPSDKNEAILSVCNCKLDTDAFVAAARAVLVKMAVLE
ncbi:MAG: hypothetical protein V3U96_02480 [Paracoccaceae bacterium]